jgi:PTH1 family peptidyl-tRNA hydrolase
MRVLAGLGNPGPGYAANRHNIGFMAADAIAERHGFSPWTKKFRGLIAEGAIGGEKILLLKPQTFMNLSGESVMESMRFYKLPMDALCVIHDELDLEFGQCKLKYSGGMAGHNGLKSIEAHLGPDFLRVRLGVGKTAGDNADHVLSDFSKSEKQDVAMMLNKLATELLPAIKRLQEMGSKNVKLDLLDKAPAITVSANKT